MTAMQAFRVHRAPALDFGQGCAPRVIAAAASFGQRVLLVRGRASLDKWSGYDALCHGFRRASLQVKEARIDGEPSVESVDALRLAHMTFAPEVVLAIGGGAVLDAAKAVAGLLVSGTSVLDHLEGVGRNHPFVGRRLPLIAVPTTAGTGSESTSNAVITRHGPNGFKKSFRHLALVPDLALLDADTTVNLPLSQSAASAMDALSQLLESYLSTQATPHTDLLALEGLRLIGEGLPRVVQDPADAAARGMLLLAAFYSGTTLMHAGLGVVHGFAPDLGSFHHIPHGQACAALVVPANRITVEALRQRQPSTSALRKYAALGRMWQLRPNLAQDEAIDACLEFLANLTAKAGVKSLHELGIAPSDLPALVKPVVNRNNPIELTNDELLQVLMDRPQECSR